METQEKGNSMSTQEKGVQEKGDTMGIREKEGSMGIQGEGSSVGPRGESTIAGIPGANGATETPGEGGAAVHRGEHGCAGACGRGGCVGGCSPADGGGQTPGAHPAVMALEVVDAILRAAAKGNPLTEAAVRRAMARVEGIARRDPQALLGLRALLARLSRALRQQRDLHAQIMGLGEDLGEALAESCAPPDDAFSLALIARRALWRARAYQSLYRFTRACDARCEELRRLRAEP